MVKKIKITLITCLVIFSGYAQIDTINEIPGIPEELPILFKGSQNLQSDLLDIFNSDSLKLFGCTDSKIIMSLLIDTNGSVLEVELIEGECKFLFEYMSEKIKKLTFFRPAMNFGHPARCIIPLKVESIYYSSGK